MVDCSLFVVRDMEKTNISDLPDEILIKIFEALKPSDILRLSEVCKKWFSITQFKTIVEKTITTVTNPTTMDLYMQSSRKFFFEIQLSKELPMEKYNQFAEIFFENIIEFNLCADITPSSFADTISSLMHLNNLQKLTVGCQFQSYDILPDNLALSVTELDLSIPPLEPSDTLVYYSILSYTPRLEELSALVIGYYMHEEIFKHLKNPELAKTLKVLKWTSEMNIYEDFSELQNLNLEKFVLNSEQIRKHDNIQKLKIFLNNQKNLKVFDLEMNVEPYWYPPSWIFSLKKLQYLSLDFESIAEYFEYDQDFDGLWTIKHVNLVGAPLDAIFHCLTKNSEMESLTLDDIMPDYFFFDITMLTDKLKFLTSLKLFSFTDFWPINIASFKQDNLLQAIFENLVNLKDLSLTDDCDEMYTEIETNPDLYITDFGITGNPNGFSITRLKYLDSLHLYINTQKITKKSIEHIESMQSLSQVTIRKSDATKDLTNPIFKRNTYLEIFKPFQQMRRGK